MLVKDMKGQPVVGKKVVAYSWAEPHFSSAVDGTANLIEGHKMAWLSGDVSLPSDENGLAVFTNLTVVGSNSGYVYIFFSCDGVTVSTWSRSKSEIYQMFNLPFFIPPIKISNTAASITIIK